MAKYLIQDTTLTSIGDAIRAKTGKTDNILVSDLATEIADISTGVELNYEVIGGTSTPSNPKENTIWVNTDQDITSYIFSAIEPETPVEGMVWFLISTSSSVEFNALKKNGIQVYPLSANQYISGAWVDKIPMTCLDGEWVDWATYLYRNGNEYTSFTGGWTSAAKKSTSSASATAATPKITRNATSIDIRLPASSNSGMAYMKNKINLNGYSTLTLYGSFRNGSAYDDNFNLCLWSAIGTYTRDNIVSEKIITRGTTHTSITFDITSLNSSYYIGFDMNSVGGIPYATITSMKLTK